LGTLSKFTTDSTAIFDVIKSSKNGVKGLTINCRNFRIIEKNVFYVFMTSDSTDFVFSWNTKDKNEAYEMFYKAKKIESIGKLTNIDRKIKQYKKWLFSLCESKYQTLRQEGFMEWQHGRKGIVLQYAQIHGLLDEYGDITEEAWEKVITETDCWRFFNILLNIDYPSWQEWELIYSFRDKYTSDVKKYTYDFLKRYSANFDKIFIDIDRREIQAGWAFTILSRIETDGKILEIISKYDKDKDRYYHSQERRILESYINPIIAQIDKELK
jgi:hypothetical protein